MNRNRNYLFGPKGYMQKKNSIVLGRKHPLVCNSNVLFSSMANPNIYNKSKKPVPPRPTTIDPNKYANLNKLLKQYGFTGKPNLSKFVNSKNSGYWEILYLDASSNIWYDYASEVMTIQNIDASNYIIEQPSYVSAIIENDKRFEYYDEAYVITENIPTTDNFPADKNIPFKNNPNLYSNLKLIATLSSLDPSPYVERTVNRTSCFVFAPGTTCYLLIYFNPAENIKKIYCMQTWTNSSYAELDPLTNMPYLNTYLAESPNVSEPLPEFWTFTQCILDDSAMIALFSNPSMDIFARVISDGIGNSYQYVREEEAPFLYEQF
jgi:hypothetical protein